MNTFKNRLDRHWKEEEFLYKFEAAMLGLHLAEDRARIQRAAIAMALAVRIIFIIIMMPITVCC